MSTDETNGYLTVQQVADRFNLTVKSVYRYVKEGSIPYYRLAGKAIRFKQSEIEAWAEMGRGGPEVSDAQA